MIFRTNAMILVPLVVTQAGKQHGLHAAGRLDCR